MKKIDDNIKELEKFPIYMDANEIEFVINMVADRREEVPELFSQLKSKIWKKIKQDGNLEKYSIQMNPFEIGFVTSLVADRRQEIPELWKQLMEMIKKFRELNNIKITELGGGLIKITDKHGKSIIRNKYEWET